ncbi:SIR2 family protein [Exiguobacterium sp. USCH10]|jgi:hypothetical protein|uniref:SIR2 family protein n=3 Tax=unclassified Exiguobacterium TaxID=2644629 RepID=UPI0030B626CB
MNIQNFLDKLDTDVYSGYLYEEFMIELLNLHISSQQKEFIVNRYIDSEQSSKEPENIKYYDKVVSGLDGFAPDGFDSFEGKTAIEIKLIKNISSLKYIVRRTIEKIDTVNSLYPDESIKNLIIIVSKGLSLATKMRMRTSVEKSILNVVIWDIDDVQKILDNHKDFKFEPRFSTVLRNQALDIKHTYSVQKDSVRERKIEELRDQFNKDNLVLFLGAGVSLDAGIPTWNNLMTNLLVSLLDEIISDESEPHKHIRLSLDEKKKLIKDIQSKNGSSPLQLVRFIRNGLNEKFQDRLKEVLYENCEKEGKKSAILESIANLSVPLRHGVGIQGIVTYNFDSLIEEQLKSKSVINFRPVFQEANMPLRNELGIFHVHGYLPRDTSTENELASDVKIQKNTLVFSEEEYHELLLDGYNWANLVQLNYFRERTCLFIGVSMTDPNVRRLLEIAKRKQSDVEQSNHFIILKRDVFSEESENSNMTKFSNVYHALKEAEFKELGLNVIWVKEHNEIPGLLDSLRTQ